MNDLVVYPLLILLIVGGFYQLYTVSTIDFSYNGTTTSTITGNQTLDGSEQSLEQQEAEASLAVTMATGIIALIISLVIIGVIAGIKVLGSGLSEYSVRLIYNSTTYYGLWAILSVIAYTAIISIPYSLGLYFWFGLTLIYSLGFFQSMNGDS